MNFFLQEDYDALVASINAQRELIKTIGKDMGASCSEGAETFHDNFAHEDGTRQMDMHSLRLRELVQMQQSAQIVTASPDNSAVRIGKRVRYTDEMSGKTHENTIGSFMVLSGSGAISYVSPVAKILVGSKVGDTKKGKIGGCEVKYKILEIS